jgi:hypothetical protein
MTTRTIQLGVPYVERSPRVRPLFDPARTSLMLAISGAVLVASVFVASLSAVPGQGHVGDIGSLRQPQPGPAPSQPR